MTVTDALSPRAYEHAQAIADGVVEAWRTYANWSKIDFVHGEGIEGFISAKIAETLHHRFSDTCRVRLEARVLDLIQGSGASTSGPPSENLRSGGRVDVAFYASNGRPKGIVEVKRHFGPQNLASDVRRVSGLISEFGVRNGGSLEWGAVVAMHTIWNSNRKSLDQRMEDTSRKLRPEAAGCTLYPVTSVSMRSEPIGEEGFLGCAGLCLFLEANARR